MNSVGEEVSVFAGVDSPFAGQGRFRSISGVGPVYEVLQDLGDVVRVRPVDRNDTLDLPRSDALTDPLA